MDKELSSIRERAEAEIDLTKRTFDEFRNLHARKIIEDESLWRSCAIATPITSGEAWGPRRSRR